MALMSRLKGAVGDRLRSGPESGDAAEAVRLRQRVHNLEADLAHARAEIARLKAELVESQGGEEGEDEDDEEPPSPSPVEAELHRPPAGVPVLRLVPPPSLADAMRDSATPTEAAQLDRALRESTDGVAYWGSIDNESARARAAGLSLGIDREECIGCGTCVEHIDTVYFLNDDEGKAYVVAQEGEMDRIQDAIDTCPVTCISWQ